ncbi:MAG TPA: hypothetical protein VD973_19325 [Symbiobacteriaceae bacterium]|nr:hypothetical protein [Symbiobacteriaceae bacterium]
MPAEQFQYQVTFPGLRAGGLTVDRVTAEFRVMDHTGEQGDRAAALRELVDAAVRQAIRRLLTEQPELLRNAATLDRVDVPLSLTWPTWFRGEPPAAVVRPVAEAMAGAVPAAAAGVLRAQAAEALGELPPDLLPQVGPLYEEAMQALERGKAREGAGLMARAEVRRRWHEAALSTLASLPPELLRPAPEVANRATAALPSAVEQAAPAAAVQTAPPAPRRTSPLAARPAAPVPDEAPERPPAPPPWVAALNDEAEALLAAGRLPEETALLLGALIGPLLPGWSPVQTAQPRPLPEHLTDPGAAPGAVAAYLKGGRKRWRHRN